MEISTIRFGPIEIETDGVIRIPRGLLGLEQCRQWVLLADVNHDALVWMQSVEQPEIALAVVDPRRFVPDYQIRVVRRELAPLELDDLSRAKVLVIVGKNAHAMTLNLKAPVLLNPERGLGCQVIGKGDLPVRYELGGEQPTLKRTA